MDSEKTLERLREAVRERQEEQLRAGLKGRTSEELLLSLCHMKGLFTREKERA